METVLMEREETSSTDSPEGENVTLGFEKTLDAARESRRVEVAGGDPDIKPARASTTKKGKYSKRKPAAKRRAAGEGAAAPAASPPAPMNLPEPLLMMIASTIPFALIAMQTGNENYRLSHSEQQMLAPLWNDVIEKYAPAFLSDYGPEFALASGIIMVLVGKSGMFDAKPPDAGGV